MSSPLRFGLLMAPVTAGLGLLYSHRMELEVLAPLEVATARVTEWLLRVVSVAVVREGTVLTHPTGFSYEIYYGCTGVFPVALLVTGLIALQIPNRSRLDRALVGIPTLLAVNLVRLVSLFLTGAVAPWAFDFAHEVLWRTVMLLVVLGFWLFQPSATRRLHRAWALRERRSP